MKKGKYTDKELEIIIKSKKKTIKELSKILDRPYEGLKKKMYDLHRDGIIKVYSRDYRLYTDKENQFIIDNPNMPTQQMCKELKRGRRTLIAKRNQLTPNFKRRRKLVKRQTDGFDKIKAFLNDKGFNNTHEAINHYGSIRAFKQAVENVKV